MFKSRGQFQHIKINDRTKLYITDSPTLIKEMLRFMDWNVFTYSIYSLENYLLICLKFHTERGNNIIITPPTPLFTPPHLLLMKGISLIQLIITNSNYGPVDSPKHLGEA